MNRTDLLRLARVGAQNRLWELQQEMDGIYRSFPDLRGGQARQTSMSTGVRGAVEGVRPRRKRRMSAEAKKRIAEAQRKRWAEWKAKKAGSDGASPASVAPRKGAAKKR